MNMDPYVLSILAKSAGSVLSSQALCMERALASSLQEQEVVLRVEFGQIANREGTGRYPVYLEADSDSIELYAKIGPDRESMLTCDKEGRRFVITGGSLAADFPHDSY
jgi:hypothetical protein